MPPVETEATAEVAATHANTSETPKPIPVGPYHYVAKSKTENKVHIYGDGRKSVFTFTRPMAELSMRETTDAIIAKLATGKFASKQEVAKWHADNTSMPEDMH